MEEKRRAIREMCDLEPLTRADIVKRLGLPHERSADHYLSVLSRYGVIVHDRRGPNARWMTPRLRDSLKPPEQRPKPVVLPENHRAQPAPVERVRINGVWCTRQAAPRSRFAPDIAPGDGVISRDWMARRGAPETA